jgi:hypothetical protein
VRPALLAVLVVLLLPAAAQAAPQIHTVRAPHRFDVVGAQWRSGPASIRLRARKLGGHWTRWVPLDRAEPVWAGGDDLVQVRSSRRLHGLRLRYVNARVSATTTAAAHKTQVTVPTGGQLAITPRAAWGAKRCKPRDTAGYGRVDMAFVHHTLSLNRYRRSDSPSIVLGICLFHRNVNRWDDIGYDFLVDRYGQVFEGRKGGIDAPVIGAHAGGFNTYSTGVAAIGDFRYRGLPPAGMSSLARLLAWKLSLSGVPAEGSVSVPSGGGRFTPYAKGTPVKLNRIAGHRDADSTECPGAALYAQLPGLRAQVAQLEGPVSRLDLNVAQSKLLYPQPLVFTGRLTPAPGLALPPGATVEIRDQLAKGGRVLATLPLAADGSFSGSLPLVHDDVIEASLPGGDGLPRVVSGAWHVTVAPAIALQASAGSLPRGSTVTLSGSVTPPKSRLTLHEEELRGGRYRRVRTLKLRARHGAFSVTVGLPRAGSFRFTARTPPSHLADPGASVPVVVQVTG